jgi:choline oxidase
MGTYDHVIVGGGTAGSIVAARLAEDPAVRVALVEAGPADEGRDEVLRVARWMELLEGELDYDYAITPQERGNAAIRHSRARVLGGCSSHNSCIAFLAPDRDLEDWVGRGAEGWEPATVRGYFDRVRERVHIAEPDVANPLLEAVYDAAEGLGLPRVRFNQGTFTDGAGPFQLNVKDGIRQSSSVAYLHPLAELPPNLTLLTGTRVEQVLVEGGRAVGVRTDRGTIRAEREVVLCAGAFDTPRLLLLSGIGPSAHLRDVGVEVVHDLPGVGEHLLDHPEGVVIFETTRPVPPQTAQLWDAGIFATVDDDAEHPDLMLHVGLVPFDLHTTAAGYPTAPHGFSLTPNVARARSEGTVRLSSADPDAPPVIDFRYFTDPDGYDERIMTAGVELARAVGRQAALRPWVARELAPGPIDDPVALSRYARRTANTVYHPAGTCRMGAAQDPDAVVDPQLRVRGLDGLRVGDASVFPSMTSVNPNITCMMIGERAADLLSAT